MKQSFLLALSVGLLTLSAVAPRAPSPVAASSVPPCTAAQLSARIVSWSGAMGSDIANVVLVNTSFATCSLRDLPRVELVSAAGHVLIAGVPASTSANTHGVSPLHQFKTEVADGNYCGPAYTSPVTLVFILPGTAGTVIAMPAGPPSVAGVPPCNGATGSAGHIAMHVWHT
jgi:Domain of unknown function (DUF4232)